MENLSFKSLNVKETSENVYEHEIRDKTINELPEGDVLIKVHYSALNYKDALVFRGHKGIAKTYPFTPGIDASGIVEWSENDKFQVGEKVLVTGYDLGMNTSGGFQEYIRVPGSWVISLPDSLSLKEAMVYGTAGFTSALAIHRMQINGILPGIGKVLVTGATGGVGVCSIAILSKLGYHVTASTGKPELSDFLLEIGANEVITRTELLDNSSRPLLGRKWKGVIENVGGATLSSIVKSMDKGGAVAIIGIITGDEFKSTLYPFILRGISLLGIESAETDYSMRSELWRKLANEWKIDNFEKISREVPFSNIPEELQKMLEGKQSKKIVVKFGNS